MEYMKKGIHKFFPSKCMPVTSRGDYDELNFEQMTASVEYFSGPMYRQD
jgi:hypothetical protein